MNRDTQKGQTLVLLLVFVVMIIAITTAATFIIANNSLAAANITQGITTRQMAESGAEKSLLGFLRDPANYHGETFTLDTGTVTVTVSGSSTVTFDSTAVNGNFTKRVEVIATYSNNVLTPTSWKDLN